MTVAKTAKNDLIPRQWYPILLSNSLKKDKPLSLKRLGKELVLWRDQTGQANAAPAACPHRGADLGLGSIKNGGLHLQCKYHGFCFNRKGRCVDVPCEGKDATIPRSLDLKILDIQEEGGFIWLWHGFENRKGEEENRPPLPKIKTMDIDWQKCQTWEMEWDISLSRVMEGMMDIHHLPFAHSPWIPGNLTRLDPYEVEVEDGVIYTSGFLGEDNRESNKKNKGLLARINIGFPSLMHMVMGQGEKPRTAKDYNTVSGFEMIGTCTPIDENRTWIAVYYKQSYVRVPLLSQIFNYLALQFDLKLIQPDDYQLLKSSQPGSAVSGSNHLVHADLGIAEWHRLQHNALETSEALEKECHAPPKIQETRKEEAKANSGYGL